MGQHFSNRASEMPLLTSWIQRQRGDALNDHLEVRSMEFGLAAGTETTQDPTYARNTIRTNKYTPLNFLPKSLFEQFRRLANFYFLAISILMMLGEYTDLFESSMSAFSTLGTLALVMGVTMAMEIKDDLFRHSKDKEVNSRLAKCIGWEGNGPHVVQRSWQDVRVGDYVVVENGDEMPADLLCLATSEPEGLCYVETSNIDGETNLKLRSAAGLVPSLPGEQPLDFDTAVPAVASRHGTVEFELPNKSINTFNGQLRFRANGEEEKVRSLDVQHLLLRGSSIRNTKWAIGLVVYTGADTKVMRNSRQTPSKMSALEIVVNRTLLVVLGAQAVLTTTAALLSIMWYDQNISSDPRSWWYIFPDVFNNFVPISLYVSIEICNFVHAGFINFDRSMHCTESDTLARCRSTNLCQELGQIQFVFSDKTGTLTRNVMEFKRCSIKGHKYGSMNDPRGFTHESFTGQRGGASGGHLAMAGVSDFFTVLAVAHTVVAELKEGEGNGEVLAADGVSKIRYEAESPDEGALVQAAANLGVVFEGRQGATLTVRVESKAKRPTTKSAIASCPRKRYEILAINQFNSTRKRMSVLVRNETGELVLLCKGADNVILDRASKAANPKEQLSLLKNHLTEFAREGLRTLLLAKRTVSASEGARWLTEFEAATNAVEGRKQKLMDVAEKIERDLVVVGATAIEDRLQDGVPETIADLREAGIKVWVLTGDKLETAINIGYSCRLLEEGMSIVTLRLDSSLGDRKTQASSLVSQLRQLDSVVTQFSESRAREQNALRATGSQSGGQSVTKKPSLMRVASKSFGLNTAAEDGGATAWVQDVDIEFLALVVTGPALEFLLDDDELRGLLLNVSKACRVVVACRVSPAQKALLVRMQVYRGSPPDLTHCMFTSQHVVAPCRVKQGITPMPITLGIGDGANDVGMIQEAQVGVGISGKEGLQAVNASDFAIAQFRFLKRLLLVHGRWNYRRVCKLILYSFYKNTVITLTIFYYCIANGFSATPIYEEMVYAGFNIFCGMPIICCGIFDKDIKEEFAIAFPSLYISGRLQLDLNMTTILVALTFAVVHSLLVSFIPMAAIPGLDLGSTSGLYVFGTTVMSCLIFIVQYRISFLTATWTWVSYFFFYGSFLLYLVFLLIYSVWYDFAPDFYWVGMVMLQEPLTYVVVIGVPCCALVFDHIVEHARREWYPSPIDIGEEIAYLQNKECLEENGDDKYPSGGAFLIRPPTFLPRFLGGSRRPMASKVPMLTPSQVAGGAVPFINEDSTGTVTPNVGGVLSCHGPSAESPSRPQIEGMQGSQPSSLHGDRPHISTSMSTPALLSFGSSAGTNDAGKQRGSAHRRSDTSIQPPKLGGSGSTGNPTEQSSVVFRFDVIADALNVRKKNHRRAKTGITGDSETLSFSRDEGIMELRKQLESASGASRRGGGKDEASTATVDESISGYAFSMADEPTPNAVRRFFAAPIAGLKRMTGSPLAKARKAITSGLGSTTSTASTTGEEKEENHVHRRSKLLSDAEATQARTDSVGAGAATTAEASVAQELTGDLAKIPPGDFFQQQLPAWQPLLTAEVVIARLIATSMVLLMLAVPLITSSNSVVEIKVQYDGAPDSEIFDEDSNATTGIGPVRLNTRPDSFTYQNCTLAYDYPEDVIRRKCNLTLALPREVKGDLYIYYELDNFYQNYNRYKKSYDSVQLDGSTTEGTCISATNSATNGNSLLPCGLVANSLFNDVFTIKGQRSCVKVNADSSESDADGKSTMTCSWSPVSDLPVMRETGIAWQSDIDVKFKNAASYATLANTTYLYESYPEIVSEEQGVTNEHFIVWMRLAALPKFRKLYGVIENFDLGKGSELIIEVDAGFLVKSFGGRKALVLSTGTWLGGKNAFLAWVLLSFSIAALIAAAVFALKARLSPRCLGDPSYLFKQAVPAKWKGDEFVRAQELIEREKTRMAGSLNRSTSTEREKRLKTVVSGVPVEDNVV